MKTMIHSMKSSVYPTRKMSIDSYENEKEIDSKLPLPKGNSPYALAKRAEYIEKDLELAKHYYKLAIKHRDRGESAIKDIASILHQEGQTKEACDFLSEHKKIFRDHRKFANLYESLQKQIIPSENCLKRILKLAPLSDFENIDSIKSMFKNSSRILEVVFHYYNGQRAGFLMFSSHSSARKTLEGMLNWENCKVDWVSAEDLEYIKSCEFWTFALDTLGPTLLKCMSTDEKTAKHLIGNDLFCELSDN
ncbi:hypothetical protein SteCoe_19489 [Stentor coeruleus]|uniref:Uncharacterized protein n=1 Tax=Stentor coeruleus TaxID=5963 RepID=A0A1R2BUF7_9CILI|nr:hypothetical protein SteCoe_19489 [Stentor coeruleus]